MITFCVTLTPTRGLFLHVADPPRITTHPQELKDAVQGKSVKFTVQATGTHPLNYRWHWKLAREGGGSGEWQPCPAEWSDGASLTMPSVQKSNEGSYCCVVSNHAGRQISNPAELSVGKNPQHSFARVGSVCHSRIPHFILM